VQGTAVNVSQPDGHTLYNSYVFPSSSESKGPPVTQLSFNVAQSAVATFSCSSTFANTPLTCARLPDSQMNTNLSITVTKGNVTCHLSLQAVWSPDETWVLAAQDEVAQFQDTPSALCIQACMLMSCGTSEHSGATLHCQPRWSSLNVTRMAITAEGVRTDTAALPLVKPSEVRCATIRLLTVE
jgi:hypothetical protein